MREQFSDYESNRKFTEEARFGLNLEECLGVLRWIRKMDKKRVIVGE